MTIFRAKKIQEKTPASRWSYHFQDFVESEEPSFRFSVSARFVWSRTDPIAQSEGSRPLVARKIRSVIEEVARNSSVLRVAATEQEINAALLRLPEEQSTDGAQIHSAHADLKVASETLEAARMLEHERQELAVEEMQRDRLRRKMDFLRSVALKDPAAARVYWLSEHRGEQDYPTSKAFLDDLVYQASLWTPENRWVVVAQLLQKFITQLPDIRRDRLVDQLAKIFAEYGHASLAEEMRQSDVRRTTNGS